MAPFNPVEILLEPIAQAALFRLNLEPAGFLRSNLEAVMSGRSISHREIKPDREVIGMPTGPAPDFLNRSSIP